METPPNDSGTVYKAVLAQVDRIGMGKVEKTTLTVFPRGTEHITAEIDPRALNIEMGSMDPVLVVDVRISQSPVIDEITKERKTIIEVLKIHRGKGTNGTSEKH